MSGGIKTVDFHTHILPCVDDGSRSVHESVQMVRSLAADSTDCIVLTPHFYARRDNPDRFFTRRDRAFAELAEALAVEENFSVPRLVPGAEIEYFEGISSLGDYPAFRLGSSRCLLLEMPLGKWTSRVIDDVLQLNSRSDCRVILAHVERYLLDQPKDTVRILLQNGVLMQSNATFFYTRRTMRKALSMLKRGCVHLLGSDCHNMTTRPPDLVKACGVITDRMGKECLAEIMQRAHYILSENNIQTNMRQP
ncbi:MAG: hypothetical protein IKD07_04440 [Clostridia bacterium]|nr:hypothetical protein [Clostridia bacterium]